MVIEAEAVTKRFDGRAIVRDFSLRIQRGDRIGVVGANGTGKTTLLKLLTGELAPDEGKVIRAKTQMHGKASTISTDVKGVFKNLPSDFSVIRYHSLVIEEATMPAELEISSRSEDGEIMGVRHRDLAGTRTPLEGVQFHPESILSEHGHAMLRNFLNLSQVQ